MKKGLIHLFMLTLTIAISSDLLAKKYYWVSHATANRNEWDSLGRWRTTSGGVTKHVQLPTSIDTVYFDANSFIANGQIVLISRGITAICADMIWTNLNPLYTGATNGPSMWLQGVANLEIFGSVELHSGIKEIRQYTASDIRFKSTSTGRTIRTNGVTFNVFSINTCELEFSSPTGGWTLLDNLTTNSLISVLSGTFNTGGFNVSCGGFLSSSNLARTLTLSSSVITLNGITTGSLQNWWDVSNSTNLTLNAGTSSIVFSNTASAVTTAPLGVFGSTALNYCRIISYRDMTLSLASTSIVFKSLVFYRNASFNNSTTISDSLFLSRGKSYLLPFNRTITLSASGAIYSGPSCTGTISIGATNLSGSSSPAPILTKTGGWGTTTITNFYITGINVTGTGTFTAAASENGGGNTGITFTAGTSKNLYWRGGTGNWADGSKWWDGTSFGCVPTSVDDVFFDAGSFTAGGQTITIDTNDAYCRNINWTGTTNSPTFSGGTSNVTTSLYVFGSLTYINTMTVNLTRAVYFEGTGTCNITSAGKDFDHNVYFDGGGTYNIMDAFVHDGNGSTTNVYSVSLNSGTLNTNNNSMYMRHFSSNTAISRTLNLGNSIITIARLYPTNTNLFNWNTSNSGLTINPGNSVIYFSNPNSNTATAATLSGSALVGSTTKLNKVIFTNPEVEVLLGTFSVDTIIFYGSAQFNFAPGRVSGELECSPGKTYTFQSSVAQSLTLEASANLKAIGTCGNPIYFNHTSTNFVITKPSGTINCSYLYLTNSVTTGGATFNATNSANLGGSSGWVVGTAVPRTLYWVGGSGSWSNNARWSLTSGGAGGECLPSVIDSVIFDNNSFPSSGQVVTVDLPTVYCKALMWVNTANTPTFIHGGSGYGMQIYGSLQWSSSMTLSYNGDFAFRSASGATIRSNGKSFLASVYMQGTGTYNLLDAFSTVYFEFRSGTFNTNNFNMSAYTYWFSTTTTARTVNLGSSTLNNTGGHFYITPSNGTSSSSGLTFNAGTSTVYATGSFTAVNSNISLYRVVANHVNFGLNGGTSGCTISRLRFATNGQVSGNNTITDSLYIAPGRTVRFQAGSSTTFGASSEISLVGTGASPITLNSLTTGSQFSWTKPSGRVCADFIYLRDHNPGGGAQWQGGGNANNQANNTLVASGGWDFSAYPVLGSATISGSATSCPSASNTISVTFTQNFYPKTLTVQRETAGGVILGTDVINVTSGDVSGGVYTYSVSPSSTTVYRLTACSIDRCFGGAETALGTATITVYSGTSGLWAGRTNTDWFTCSNWDDGIVPTSTTDVLVPNGLATYPTIGAAGAVCRNITIASGGSTPRLTINNSASTLTVYGNITLNGTFSHTNGSVTLTGTSANNLNGSTDYTFYNLIVNNSNNAVMNRGVSINNNLTINSGKFSINNQTLALFGTITCTDSLLGSTSSTLNISGTGPLGTIKFSTTNRSVGTLNMNRTATGTAILGTPLRIISAATFTNGLIYSTATNYIEFTDNASWNGASNNSYVDGVVRKTGNDAFIFPIGKGGEYHYCGISAPSLVTDQFSAEYFHIDPVNTFGTNKEASLHHISTCEYWDIDRTNGSSDVKVTLSWTPTSCGYWSGVNSPADLTVAHWFDTAIDIWEDLDNDGTWMGNNNNGQVTASLNSSSYSPFTLASKTGNNPLPIELIVFNAFKNGTVVDLNWSTATETNNDYFTIERSKDGVTFDAIIVKKGAPNGNSIQRLDYMDVDNKPYNGINYYRLKQTDFDKQESFSKIIYVNFNSFGENNFNIYPSLINISEINSTHINLSGLRAEVSTLIVMHDMLGKEYYSKLMLSDVDGNAKFILENTDELAAGIYFISASSNDKLLSKKIIIR